MNQTVGVVGVGLVADLRFVYLASVAVLRSEQLDLISISLVQVYGVSVILCQMATFLSYFVTVWIAARCELMMLHGADCDWSLHASMDGASNAFGYVERAGDGDIAGMHNRMGLVFNGWTE